jgi:hypothetical protein
MKLAVGSRQLAVRSRKLATSRRQRAIQNSQFKIAAAPNARGLSELDSVARGVNNLGTS